MSFQQGQVISLILLERFGSFVANIGEILFKSSASLAQIKKSTDFPLSKVKEALSILIKYNLVSFKLNQDETTAVYSLQLENIFLMLRFPKYINLIKKKFDEEVEVLLEEILLKGCLTASEVILKAATRLKEKKNENLLLHQLKDKFITLVNAKYVKKILLPYSENKSDDLFPIPDVDLKPLLLIMNGSTESIPESDEYWTINIDRFHQDMRDQLIVTAISNKFDENMGELIRILLQQMYIRTKPWMPVSNPIPILEVKEILKKRGTHPELLTYFDQYVSVLEQDSNNIITKVGEASGGSFQIEMKQIFNYLTWETIEHIVNEKYDTKASRIFRLVKSRNYIEPEQLQNLVMIPAKEAKRITYQLLEENFLVINELKRSAPSLGPNKSFTLFHIRLSQIVRTTLELCYKSLFNTTLRRHHEKQLNKRLIDKKHRVDTITHGMLVQGISGEPVNDIEEMITPPEKEILDKIAKMLKILSQTELEIDETMFLLQMYLAYEK